MRLSCDDHRRAHQRGACRPRRLEPRDPVAARASARRAGRGRSQQLQQEAGEREATSTAAERRRRAERRNAERSGRASRRARARCSRRRRACTTPCRRCGISPSGMPHSRARRSMASSRSIAASTARWSTRSVPTRPARRYSAEDPSLVLWVHATLLDSLATRVRGHRQAHQRRRAGCMVPRVGPGGACARWR